MTHDRLLYNVQLLKRTLVHCRTALYHFSQKQDDTIKIVCLQELPNHTLKLTSCLPMVGGSPASSTTKTGRHDIAEILLNVALNTNNQIKSFVVLAFAAASRVHLLL
jgi:hypothetical protein